MARMTRDDVDPRHHQSGEDAERRAGDDADADDQRGDAQGSLHAVILPCRPAFALDASTASSPMRRDSSSRTRASCSSASRRADDGLQRPLVSQIRGTKMTMPARST